MKKLKTKYKWSDREQHLKAINQDEILAGYLIKYAPMLGFGSTMYIASMRRVLPISDEAFENIVAQLENQVNHYSPYFFLKAQWSKEDIVKIKNKYNTDPAGLLVVSALEKVDGMTNPLSDSESSHTTDDIKKWEHQYYEEIKE